MQSYTCIILDRLVGAESLEQFAGAAMMGQFVLESEAIYTSVGVVVS